MAKKTGKDKDDKDSHSPLNIARYKHRIAVMRKANEYADKDNIVLAVQGYVEYLDILAKWYKVEEKDLRPDMFDVKTNLTEMLLISQVYWGLAKAYDRNIKLKPECARALEQFVRFSIGFKYQYVNQQLLRKFIKKGIAYNPKLFSDAYTKLQIDSKKCYVASHCFGYESETTNFFRAIKVKLVKSYFGFQFVKFYYHTSPALILFCRRHDRLGRLVTTCCTLFLTALAKVLKRFAV